MEIIYITLGLGVLVGLVYIHAAKNTEEEPKEKPKYPYFYTEIDGRIRVYPWNKDIQAFPIKHKNDKYFMYHEFDGIYISQPKFHIHSRIPRVNNYRNIRTDEIITTIEEARKEALKHAQREVDKYQTEMDKALPAIDTFIEKALALKTLQGKHPENKERIQSQIDAVEEQMRCTRSWVELYEPILDDCKRNVHLLTPRSGLITPSFNKAQKSEEY